MNYFKVNKLVAEELNLTTERNRTKDGAYILWYADINRLGSMADVNGIMRRIGGLELSPNEARNELYGVHNEPLPVAEDERFILPQNKVNNVGTPADDMKPDETDASAADNAESMGNADNGVEGAGDEGSTDEDSTDTDSTKTSTDTDSTDTDSTKTSTDTDSTDTDSTKTSTDTDSTDTDSTKTSTETSTNEDASVSEEGGEA